jgi:hypothetical protein
MRPPKRLRIGGGERQRAFDQLKAALLQAPALTLPDPIKSFTLFVDEKKGVAKEFWPDS